MRHAIDSVLAQSYPNIELIIVNDGSKDNGATEAIALSYGSRVRYYAKPNGGVASALNLALEKASGDYFGWLSHDDIYLPEKVAKEMDFLLALPDPHAVVFCRHALMNAAGEYLHVAPSEPAFKPGQAAYQLIYRQRLHCCTILAPKSLYLEAGGFREDLPTTQDYDLLIKIALKHPFFGLPEILLHARSHAEQGSLTMGHLAEVENFFDENIPLLSPAYMAENFTPEEAVSAFESLGREMLDRSHPRAALLAMKQLLVCEAVTADPAVLWRVMSRLTARYDPSATLSNVSAAFFIRTSGRAMLKTLLRKILPSPVIRVLRRLRRMLAAQPSVSVADVREVKEASLDFVGIYNNNGFEGTESRSGGGSTLLQTRVISTEIPKLLKELDIRHFLDVPCGDLNWMRHIDFGDVLYTGGDIVQSIVDKNAATYGNEKRKFERMNITTGPLPKADLIFCRDCLVHLNYADGLAALEQFRRSGAKWLLTTTFIDRPSNSELYEGTIWRPLNLEKAPYNLPKADRYINEGCTEGDGMYGDKCLALWRISDAHS